MTVALAEVVAFELGLNSDLTARIVALFDAGNTIPFLARYRKEMTGGLDEVALRSFQTILARHRKLEERRGEILRLLADQNALTPEIESRLRAADRVTILEDLYLPFRPKRRTRAMVARERGLGSLADLFRNPPGHSPLEAARQYVSPGKDIVSAEIALAGARDILAELASEDPEVRGRSRHLGLQEAIFHAVRDAKTDDPQGKFEHYYAYSEPVGRMQSHRVLAGDRGQAEGVLKIRVELPGERIIAFMRERWGVRIPLWREEAEAALADGFKRLLAPALERDIRSALTEKAQTHAITVFGANLKALLLQAPVRGKVVLGIDPGFRTGCKVVVVDPTGKPLFDGFAIYPHEPQGQWRKAAEKLISLIAKYDVDVIAIGNGTASRETERLVAEAIAGLHRNPSSDTAADHLGGERRNPGVAYAMVSEAGASVYSASEVARQEFPGLAATQRGTISIARRLQDPLAELVKIDPQAIGVGQYQHDLDPKALGAALDAVVEDTVNHVGVDLNTASIALLTRVAGLNSTVAQEIVAYREAKGRFQTRIELEHVKGLGRRKFEQCAGFLRIPGGKDALDNTAIHPESYGATRKLLGQLGLDPRHPKLSEAIADRRRSLTAGPLAEELGLGLPTLRDILDNLEKPGRDPREDLPLPHFRQDVLKLEDLQPGMRLTGTVRNVVDFGAFVDIGVKNDGLVHISELADRFIGHPLDVVTVGEVIEIEVIDVDKARQRVSLSRKRVLESTRGSSGQSVNASLR